MPITGGDDFLKYIVTATIMGLLPFLIVTTTSFLKLSVVFSVLRTALGLQQTPSNLIIFSFSLILTCYIMSPVLLEMYQYYIENKNGITGNVSDLATIFRDGLIPYRRFLASNASPDSIEFFFSLARDRFPPEAASLMERDSIAVLMPSFMVSQLSDSFKISVLIYLPFLIIDLVVGIILLTLGMMMMSPVVVSLPIKIMLFVMLDGWKFLTEALVQSFSI